MKLHGWLGLILAILVAAPAWVQAAEVELAQSGENFALTVDGEPFQIKGAGGDASLDELVEAGGNSIRTWGVDETTQRILDEAHRRGLKVTVGIWLGHGRHGFNYRDPDQIAAQYENAQRWVEEYKDHPALLMWGVGNEMEGTGDGDDMAIWAAVNDIAEMIHQIDPEHPTMTVVAEIGGRRVEAIHELCPAIDIVGINSYAGARSIPQRYREAGGTKPYIVTEYGPAGVWEIGRNDWDAVEEPTSTAKAEWYRAAYQAFEDDADLCLGSYAFTWGNKQEATATWFGMFLPDGSKLEAVDEMTRLWSGEEPADRVPQIEPVEIAGDGQLDPGQEFTASVVATDPEGAALEITWSLSRDPMNYNTGGDAQAAPPSYPDAILEASDGNVRVKMPATPGRYRLFAEVHDPAGGAAVANVPLLVRGVERPSDFEAPVAELPLVLVGDEADSPYHPSGYMGDTAAISLDPAHAENPHSGETCMQAVFDKADGWGGVVWQSPANDWGDQPGGRDLSAATRLTFWARGAEGGERVTFSFGILDRDSTYYDTAKGELEVTLSDEWQEYSIDLTRKDLRRIKTPFVWVVAGQGRPVTFYLDDVTYE